MEELFSRLGFNAKETSIYLHLIEGGPSPATEISKAVKESRTNTYMVLDKLSEKGFIRIDDSQSVRRFCAEHPDRLKAGLLERQKEMAETKRSFDAALPELLSAFNLGNHNTGVVSLQGLDGLKAAMEDMTKSKTELLVWCSHVANKDLIAWRIIENAGYKRRSQGIATRALFQKEAADWSHIQNFKNKGFEVRLWGENPFMGEVVIYGSKVAITAYEPEILITILTNQVIADTFRTIFENSWKQSVALPGTVEK